MNPIWLKGSAKAQRFSDQSLRQKDWLGNVRASESRLTDVSGLLSGARAFSTGTSTEVDIEKNRGGGGEGRTDSHENEKFLGTRGKILKKGNQNKTTPREEEKVPAKSLNK